MRSASSTSDLPVGSTAGHDDATVNGGPSKTTPQSSVPAPKTTGRNKRGVRKQTVQTAHEPPTPIDGEEGSIYTDQ
jgi:hypothetical protein